MAKCSQTWGDHCYHPTQLGHWYGVTPPPMICCHCGKTPEQEHGPFLPKPPGTVTVGPGVGINIGGSLIYKHPPTGSSGPNVILDGKKITNKDVVFKKYTLEPTKKSSNKPKKKKK